MQNSGSQRKRKLNNRGLSLVEVMVGIVILAIVTGPLLSSFVSAMRFNQRAKERQRTTTAAQSIMEGFKAYDVEALCWQFSGDAAYPFRVIANVNPAAGVPSGEEGAVWEEALSDRDGDGVPDTSIVLQADGTYAFKPASDGHYAFAMQNISFKIDASDTAKLYDARVEIRPKAPLPDADFNGTKEMVSFENMNSYLDAVYKQPASQDQLAYTQILNLLLDELNDQDESEQEFLLEDLDTDKLYVSKTMEVLIESPSAGVCIVSVKTTYHYETVHYPYEAADGSEQELLFSGELDAAGSPTVIYNNELTAAEGARLENVYLYYYPAYKNVADVKINAETVLLQNNSGEGKNIYLIKQVNGLLSNGRLLTCENSYTPTVSGGGSTIYLYHNLNQNLAGGATVGTVTMGGVTENTQVVGKNPEHLLYEVVVSVYKAGAAANGFPAEDCLLELNGSMNK